jgi:hypothetical protein
MGKIQKHSDSECYTPSPKSSSFYISVCLCNFHLYLDMRTEINQLHPKSTLKLVNYIYIFVPSRSELFA